MNRRAIIPLVLGLAVGLVAVKLVMDSVKRARGSESQNKFTIVQAKRDIKAFEKISAEMVAVIKTSDSALAPPFERLDTVEMVIGRVSAKAIPENSPILKSMLAPEGTPPGITAQIPPGFRAVSVKIDEVTSAGYNLQPGDWVDVIVVMDIETGLRGRKETIAEVILQHVQVAAIGLATEQESAGAKVKPAKSATLLVRDADAPKLHLAGTRGKITLVLRGHDDGVTDEPIVAYGKDLFGDRDGDPPAPAPSPAPSPAPAPAPAPTVVRLTKSEPEPEPHTILVFRGQTSGTKPAPAERITFESSKSSKIIAVGLGAPTGAASTMRESNRGTVRRPKEPKEVTPQAAEPNSADEVNGGNFESGDE